MPAWNHRTPPVVYHNQTCIEKKEIDEKRVANLHLRFDFPISRINTRLPSVRLSEVFFDTCSLVRDEIHKKRVIDWDSLEQDVVKN